LYITDQDVHLKTWQRAVRAVAETSSDGGEAAIIPAINTFNKAELNGLRVLLRLDLNITDENGKIKSLNRLIEALPTIIYYIENGATVVLTSHNSRPKGKVKTGTVAWPGCRAAPKVVERKRRRHKRSIS